MPWEVREWWKLISPPKFLSQDSSLFTVPILTCFDFSSVHTTKIFTSSWPLPQRFLSQHPTKSLLLIIIPCSSVPLSPPPTAPYVPHLFPAEQSLVSEIWQLKWPPLCGPPAEVSDCSQSALLCSPQEQDPHLRVRAIACPHSHPSPSPSPDAGGFSGHRGLLFFGEGALNAGPHISFRMLAAFITQIAKNLLPRISCDQPLLNLFSTSTTEKLLTWDELSKRFLRRKVRILPNNKPLAPCSCSSSAARTNTKQSQVF